MGVKVRGKINKDYINGNGVRIIEFELMDGEEKEIGFASWMKACPLCGKSMKVNPFSEPLGWHKIWGHRGPRVRECDSCYEKVREEIICPECVKIVKKTFEITGVPFEIELPNERDYSKPISLGTIMVW